jgi:hypothetical protein
MYEELIRRITRLERRLDDLNIQEYSPDLVAPFLALPGLRGFWTFGAFTSGLNAIDLSGHGHDLTDNGWPEYGYDGVVPYVELDGSGDYFSRTDEADLDIIGNETYILDEARGLTMGGWFQFDVVAGPQQYFYMKYINGANGSYGLFKQNAASTVRGIIINGGAGTYSGTGITIEVDKWYFIVMRFTPLTEVKLWVNSTVDTNTTAIPATIDNSTAPLTIGADGLGNYEMTGLASCCFLCCEALSDGTIGSLLQQTRGAFGV